MAQQGFASWRPTGESREILALIQQVLEDYKDYLPMTGRQIFYRMVGAYGYAKSEAAANRVYNVLGRARRAMLIPFNAVRDGGGSKVIPLTYDDAAAFWEKVRDDRRHFSRDRQAGQDVRIELFCEAPGMMPQLQAVAFPYSVSVHGTRGFTSISTTADVARRALERDERTVLLQVGDYDPSGVAIFESLVADARAFVWQVVHLAQTGDEKVAIAAGARLGVSRDWIMKIAEGHANPDLTARRIAITWEQVEEHGLPTAPPAKTKHGDVNPHGYNWVGETAQAEALPPDLLAQIVREEIEGELDMERYREEVDAEGADEDQIDEVLVDV